MKKKTGKTRTLYSSEFKERAIKLAKELGSTRVYAQNPVAKPVFGGSNPFNLELSLSSTLF